MRVILWNLKGVLLLIALAAGVMWPVSRGHLMTVVATHSISHRDSGHWRYYRGACWDGWLVVGRSWRHSSGDKYAAEVTRAEGWR